MSQAYTPGLLVTSRTRYRARRQLPIAGEVLVKVGDSVNSQQVVAKSELPGDVTPINMSNQLSLSPGEVPGAMLKHEGETVAPGDVLARTKGIFGFFKSEATAKCSGTIESISNVTGQLLVRGAPIPVEVRADVTGKVVEVLPDQGCVIEAEVTQVQGIFGIGGEAFGNIRMACKSHEESLDADHIKADMKGCIVIGGARMRGETVQRAIEVGVAAVVSGGIDDADLREILGSDLGVAITGTEQIGTTLIITEGFGDIAMAQRTFDLMKSREGSAASVNGATQIRAGVMRPEIIIPTVSADNADSATNANEVADGGGMLQVGATVRIIRDPYFGIIGTVSDLPSEPQTLESGSKARVLKVKARDGSSIVVPRANVEMVGG